LVPSRDGEMRGGINPADPPADLEPEACGNPPAPAGMENLDDPRLELTVLLDNRWGTGYCQDYMVKNISDEDVVGWAIRIRVPGPIRSGYTAARDSDEGWVTFRPGADWARTIRPGQQVTFGFCGTL